MTSGKGGANTGRGRGGGRGSFTPRHNTVNAVCEDAENQVEEYHDKEEQYDKNAEVVAFLYDVNNLN